MAHSLSQNDVELEKRTTLGKAKGAIQDQVSIPSVNMALARRTEALQSLASLKAS